MSKLGQRLIKSAKGASAYASGGVTTGFVVHDMPDVKAIRKKLGLTQAGFATGFGLPVGSVRDWEQGRSAPDASARVLLKVISAEPKTVRRIVEG